MVCCRRNSGILGDCMWVLILERVFLAQRRRMYSKIENFVHHNELEQAERLAGRIPDYDEYMRIRYGVTGVRMFSLLLE